MKKHSSLYSKSYQNNLRKKISNVVHLSELSDDSNDFSFSDVFLNRALELSKLVRISQNDNEDEEIDADVQDEYEIPKDEVDEIDPTPFASLEDLSKRLIVPGLYSDEEIKTVPSKPLYDSTYLYYDVDKVEFSDLVREFIVALSAGGNDISKCLFSLSSYVYKNKREYTHQEEPFLLLNQAIVLSLQSYFKIKDLSIAQTWHFERGQSFNWNKLVNDIRENIITDDSVHFLKNVINEHKKLIESNISFKDFLSSFYDSLDQDNKAKIINFWVEIQANYKIPDPTKIPSLFDTERLLLLVSKFDVDQVIPAYMFLNFVTMDQLLQNRLFMDLLDDSARIITINCLRFGLSSASTLFYPTQKNVNDEIVYSPNLGKVYDILKETSIPTPCSFVDNETGRSQSYFTKKIVDYFSKHSNLFFSMSKDSYSYNITSSFTENVIDSFGNDPYLVLNLLRTYNSKGYNYLRKEPYDRYIERAIDQKLSEESDPRVKNNLEKIYREFAPNETLPFVFLNFYKCNPELAEQFFSKLLSLSTEETINPMWLDNLPSSGIYCEVSLKYMIKYLDHFEYKQKNSSRTNYNFNKLEFDLKLLYDFLGEKIYDYCPKELNFITSLIGEQSGVDAPINFGMQYTFDKINTILQNNSIIFKNKLDDSFSWNEFSDYEKEFIDILRKYPAAYDINLENMQIYIKKLLKKFYVQAGKKKFDPDTWTPAAQTITLEKVAALMKLFPEVDYIFASIINDYALDLNNIDSLRQISSDYLKNKPAFYGNYKNILTIKGLNFADNKSRIPPRFSSLSDNDLGLILMKNEFSQIDNVSDLIKEYQVNSKDSTLEKNYQRLLACKASIAKSRNYVGIEEGSLEYNKILYAIYKNFNIRGADPKLITLFLDMTNSRYPDNNRNKYPIIEESKDDPNIKSNSVHFELDSSNEFFVYGLKIIQIFRKNSIAILKKYNSKIPGSQEFDYNNEGMMRKLIHDVGVLLPTNMDQNYPGLDDFMLANLTPSNKSTIMKICQIWNDEITEYEIIDNRYIEKETKLCREFAKNKTLSEMINIMTTSSIFNLANELGSKVKNLEFLKTYASNYVFSDKVDKSAQGLNEAQKEKLYVGLQKVYMKGLKTELPYFANYDKTINGVRMRFLPREDPRGMFLGVISGCCQHPLGEAGSCAIDGHINKRAAFCVWEYQGELILESYVWSDKKGNICFDSFETIGGNAYHKSNIKESITALLEDFGNSTPPDVYVVGGSGIRHFMGGTIYTRIFENPTKTNEKDYVSELLYEFSARRNSELYTDDSENQMIIKKGTENIDLDSYKSWKNEEYMLDLDPLDEDE